MDASNLLGKPMPQLAKERFGVTTDTIRNDQDICFALLAGMCQPEGHHFATMPASCFGIDSNKGWLRLCFSISTPELEQMFPIFEQIAAA
jgi:aspartate/methionine/tyrosine aminotransferase